MFWDKKEDKNNRGLPDLPPLNNQRINFGNMPGPSFPEIPQNENQFPDRRNLPPLRQDNSGIREAIAPQEIPGYNPNASFRPTEVSDMDEPMPAPDMSEDYPQSLPQPKSLAPPPMPGPSKVRKDIFVKIEKFQSARKALASAQDQMKDIDNLIRKIREVRMREDQELAAWEKDLTETKNRIEEVSQNLFDKIE